MKQTLVCRYLFGSSSNKCLGEDCAQFIDGMCVDKLVAISLKKIAESTGCGVVADPSKVVKKVLVEKKDKDSKDNKDNKDE